MLGPGAAAVPEHRKAGCRMYWTACFQFKMLLASLAAALARPAHCLKEFNDHQRYNAQSGDHQPLHAGEGSNAEKPLKERNKQHTELKR